MTGPVIETPRGKIIITKAGKAQLIWDTSFKPKWETHYSAAQKFVDSEVIRLSEPMTPLRTSMLIKSATLGTDIGSGTVQWIAPYSRAQYYNPRPIGRETGPLRGGQWFERMKAVHKPYLIAGARRIAGSGSK